MIIGPKMSRHGFSRGTITESIFSAAGRGNQHLSIIYGVRTLKARQDPWADYTAAILAGKLHVVNGLMGEVGRGTA
ncbi:MAG: hypothetical protein BZY88_07515 [SAR202 cluster bacterium Io17-Chloro-G9]|nr:MAG: hypothetical protein BZY88_07515 [SAR202 cluster bacterium Io17-Chloro-G9]